MNIDRRAFLRQTSWGLAAACIAPSVLSCTPQQPAGSLNEIGLQLYTLRDQLADHVQDTISRVAEIGYDHVETFGLEFDSRGKALFWGMDVQDLATLLHKNGLKTHSGHYDLSDFLTPSNGNDEVLKATIDVAASLAQQYIIVPIPPLSLIDELTADDYRFMADQLNKGGELAAQSGLKIGYHNHFWEFRTFDDGSRGLDILIENTDMGKVVFELDLFWSEKSGLDSATYMEQYPGRFPLWHIKDVDPTNAASVVGSGYDDQPALSITESITYTEVGTGSIDFHRIMTKAQTAGLRYAFIEQDIITIDPFESIAKSYHYVKEELI